MGADTPPRPDGPPADKNLFGVRATTWARSLVLLILLVASGAVWTLVATEAPAAPLTVAFIGDSYTGGSDMGGNGEQNFTRIVGRELGWNVVNRAAGGTGYVKRAVDAAPFEEQQLEEVVAAQPSVVVVVGSRNDIDETPTAITDAAVRLYRDIRNRLPNAKLLVVGPIWPGEAPPAIDAVRTAVLRATKLEGVSAVDPITDRWFDDGVPGLIGSDEVHPNDAGHAYIAQRMIIALQRTATISR